MEDKNGYFFLYIYFLRKGKIDSALIDGQSK